MAAPSAWGGGLGGARPVSTSHQTTSSVIIHNLDRIHRAVVPRPPPVTRKLRTGTRLAPRSHWRRMRQVRSVGSCPPSGAEPQYHPRTPGAGLPADQEKSAPAIAIAITSGGQSGSG